MLSGLGRMRIAGVFGIPVHVHASWLIVLILMVWTLAGWYFPLRGAQLGSVVHWIQGLSASLLVFASILVHEMGHAVVARRNGLGIRSVTLFVFGGVAQLEREAEDGGTEVRMALAGPAVSLVVAAVFGLAAGAPFLGAPARDVAGLLALVNGGVVLFNLVPAFPLDGGRLLRGLLWNRIGKEPATRAAARGGSLFAVFLMVMGALTLIQGAALAGVWYFALGIFLKDAADRARSQASLDETLRGLRVRDVMLTDVETLAADLSVAEAAAMHFRRTGYGSYPVTRGQVVVGLLCLRDVVQVPKSERVAVSIQAVMKPLSPALLAGADEPLDTAMRRLVRNEAARLLVLENGRLVGLLTMSSLLRHIQVREELAA